MLLVQSTSTMQNNKFYDHDVNSLRSIIKMPNPKNKSQTHQPQQHQLLLKNVIFFISSNDVLKKSHPHHDLSGRSRFSIS